MTHDDVFHASDAFLHSLDGAIIGSGTIFKDTVTKEWMETAVLRAFAKIEAAEYHASNVARRVVQKHEKLKPSPGLTASDEKPKGTVVRVQGTFPVQEIAYEIDAFLAAARAAIDFLANILALHLGMNHRSGISSVRKHLKKFAHSPFTFLLDYEEWIDSLKDYRDECVHYRALRGYSGYEAIRQDDTTVEARIPFVIPKRIRSDMPDTRARRAFGTDSLEGLSRFESTGRVSSNDGTTRVIQLTVGYEPAPGYILAESFCMQHQNTLRAFAVRLLNEVPKLGFALQKAEKHGKPASSTPPVDPS
jgi:hypothetical protein